MAVQLIDQICEAVQELHQHGVIHRDITPANVIVAQDGAHLIDFGIASPEHYGFAKQDARSEVF